MQLTLSYPASEGEVLFTATKDLGWEGVVAKRLGSPYRAGVRSRDWIKVKHFHTTQFAVGGGSVTNTAGSGPSCSGGGSPADSSTPGPWSSASLAGRSRGHYSPCSPGSRS